MFDKPINELTFGDIENLINIRKQQEGSNIDFKMAPSKPDDLKKTIIKTFSAFANSNGGYLILGISEAGKQTKKFEIEGINPVLDSIDIIEWINQIAFGNIEPRVIYPDPVKIEIPGSERIIVVPVIFLSIDKPHMFNSDHKYYIRINDSSKPASHYLIRDMFESSRNKYKEIEEFLSQRSLLNSESKDFANNRNTRYLKSDIFQGSMVLIPKLIFSFIPKHPGKDVVDIQSGKYNFWLENNSIGNEPYKQRHIFTTHEDEINLEGISFKSYSRKSYIEFLSNGYIEQGLCDSVFWIWERQNNKISTLHITWCVGQLMSLLYFAKKYYGHIHYNEQIILQISFSNVINYSIIGFNEIENKRKFRLGSPLPKNSNYNNFKLISRFFPTLLNDEMILKISKYFAKKILNAFGLNNEKFCFINDEIDVNLLSQMRDIA